MRKHPNLETKFERPVAKTEINTDKIKSAAEEYIKAVEKGGENKISNAQQFLFEASFESVFGKEAWNYINSKL